MDLESAFEAFDANGDGIISPAEFKRGLNKLSINLSSAQVHDLLRYIDRDGDGHIDLREFKRKFGHSSSSAGPSAEHEQARKLQVGPPRSSRLVVGGCVCG